LVSLLTAWATSMNFNRISIHTVRRMSADKFKNNHFLTAMIH
jgi:hypothetical protein